MSFVLSDEGKDKATVNFLSSVLAWFSAVVLVSGGLDSKWVLSSVVFPCCKESVRSAFCYFAKILHLQRIGGVKKRKDTILLDYVLGVFT